MKRNIWMPPGLACAALSAALTVGLHAAETIGYQDTPLIPGTKWHVHDGTRPQPPIVTPGTSSTPEQPARPPSDAIVLFDGTDLSKWRAGDGQAARWLVENGVMIVPPKVGDKNVGDVYTREAFGDCQLHIEWATPTPPKGSSQGRGNSGIFFMDRYELQVLDSYENKTYPDGQAAALYGQHPPLVNASRKPGEWQTYDVFFTAPRFKDGALESPAYITVLHNGVLVQNHRAYLGPSGHRNIPKYRPHPDKAPVRIQDHGDPVRFRNIWIRPLTGQEQ